MVTTAVGGAVAFASGAPLAAAAEPADPFTLPGATPSAMVADVDGDGARELVRLTGSVDEPMRLEVWDVTGRRWAITMSVELDALSADPREAGGPTATALVRTQVDGTDRALLFTGGPVSDSGSSECCLTVHEVRDAGDGSVLRRVPLPELPADSIVAADLDGDGTDELVASLITWSEEEGLLSSTDVTVLAWEAGALSTIAEWQEQGAWWVNTTVESDDLPGAELLASSEANVLARVALIDGAVAIERAELTIQHEQAWVAGSVDGNLVVASPTAVALVAWPRDGHPTVLATHATQAYPSAGVIGSGADALIVVQQQDDRGSMEPVSQVLDARLRSIGEVAASPSTVTLTEVADQISRVGWEESPPTNVWPYFGPDNGEWGVNATSFIVGGTRISVASGGAFDTHPSATLVGRPLGRLGPDAGWVALGDIWTSSGGIAYLQAGYPFAGAWLTLVPLTTFQDPAERTLATSVAFDGGIAIDEEVDLTTVLAGPTGAEIVVGVVPGTRAVSWDGTTVTDHGAVVGGVLRLPVDPPNRPRPGREYTFERDLVLVGPDGTASVHRWEGAFALEAPELSAWADVETMSLEATVSGRASSGSVVTVDGNAVALNAFGAYRATVSAPPWPRNVIVIARDPFGGEQRTTVQVIGLVDYRGLPWVPIAAIATVLVGGVLFLRTPRHRPTLERAVLDDGRLEDLDGDLI